jgi:WD40 repeat protein
LAAYGADDGENHPVTALAAYSRRQWLAVGFENGRIDLLSLRDGHPVGDVAISPHAGPVTDLSFAPNGDFLASSSGDSTIQLWRTEDWERLPPLRGHAGEVRDIDFDAESKQLVSDGDDGVIRLWTLTKNAAPTVLRIRKEHGEIVAVEFTHSGEKVSFIDVRGQADSVDIVAETFADRVCDMVWRNLSKQEWERFIPDTDYECTCPELGPDRMLNSCP